MSKTQPTPVAGVHQIDSGTCELAPDPIAGGWLLTINGAHSSHIDPDDPLLLDFDYMRQMVAVIEQRYAASAALRETHRRIRLLQESKGLQSAAARVAMRDVFTYFL